MSVEVSPHIASGLVSIVSPYYVDQVARLLGLGYRMKEIKGELDITFSAMKSALPHNDDDGNRVKAFHRRTLAVLRRIEKFKTREECIEQAKWYIPRIGYTGSGRFDKIIDTLYTQLDMREAAESLGMTYLSYKIESQNLYRISESRNRENFLFRLSGIHYEEWDENRAIDGGLSPWVKTSISITSPSQWADLQR